MNKRILLLLLPISIVASAATIYVDESKFPMYINPLEGNFTDNMWYSDCQNYVGHYFYIVSSPNVRKDYFFVKNYNTKNFINDKDKLFKYRFFNKNSFMDYTDKVYRVSNVQFVKVKNNFSYTKNYIEFTLEDIENPKASFKYLNEGEYNRCPECPFIDVAYYKYHQTIFDKSTRYKIQSKAIKGTTDTNNSWWTFKGVAFDDEIFDIVYVFEFENSIAYVYPKDTKKYLFFNENDWQQLCTKKGEEYAYCKLEQIVKLGMSRQDVLDIMGKPDGVAYDSRNIHTGLIIYRYNNQWVEIEDNKIINVDLYKTLWKKGDMYMIELLSKKLY